MEDAGTAEFVLEELECSSGLAGFCTRRSAGWRRCAPSDAAPSADLRNEGLRGRLEDHIVEDHPVVAGSFPSVSNLRIASQVFPAISSAAMTKKQRRTPEEGSASALLGDASATQVQSAHGQPGNTRGLRP